MAVFILTAVMLAALCGGYAVSAPTIRARWQLFRGNYAAAAEIYEKQLARHPHRLRFYSALAEIYLLLPRSDEQALQVFKKVLRFNLNTPNREEIEAIVLRAYEEEHDRD